MDSLSAAAEEKLYEDFSNFQRPSSAEFFEPAAASELQSPCKTPTVHSSSSSLILSDDDGSCSQQSFIQSCSKFREKCGEIFIENGKYTINCEFCDEDFDFLLEEFSAHMIDVHLALPIPPAIESMENLNENNDEQLNSADEAELEEILNRTFSEPAPLPQRKNENLLNTIQEFGEGQIADCHVEDDSILIPDDEPTVENISCEIDAGLFFNYQDDDSSAEYQTQQMNNFNVPVNPTHHQPQYFKNDLNLHEINRNSYMKNEWKRDQDNPYYCQSRQQQPQYFKNEFNSAGHISNSMLKNQWIRQPDGRYRCEPLQQPQYFKTELNSEVGNSSNSSIIKNQWTREQDGRYHCQYCDKNYQYSKSLKEHIESHHRTVDKDFVCTICSKAFSKQWKLNTHLKVHTDERPFFCSVCVMTFKWKKNLQRHLMRIHNIKLSELPRESYCANENNSKLKELLEKPQTNSSANGSESRTDNSIGINNSIGIDESGAIGDSIALEDSIGMNDSMGDLNDTIDEHDIEEGLAADFAIVNHCIDDDDDENEINNFPPINENAISSVNIGDGNRTSNVENFSFNPAPQFSSNSIKLENNYEGNNFLNQNFIDENCAPEAKRQRLNENFDPNFQNSYGNYGNLLRENEYIPIGSSNQSTSFNADDERLDSIHNHFETFSNTNEEYFAKPQTQATVPIQPNKDGLYSCKVCKKVYLRKDSLRAHTRIHTAGLSCSYCGKMFTHKYFLDRHVRTHTGERPFQCNLCSLAFADENTLKNHIKTHTGEKKFECQFCQKKFIKQYEKIDHERNIHNNQNPYECKDCREVFNQFKFLRYHKRFCPNRK